MLHDMGTECFKEQRPEQQMSRHFEKCWRIIRPPSQLSMYPQDQRQGTGNQPKIIEIRMQKRIWQIRLEQQAIHCVGQTAKQEHWIAMETKGLHSKARMKNPTLAARAALSTIKVML